jgi:starch synthase
MKILFAASEIAPFFRTGGLAEVAGSLPAALAKLGAGVCAVMPLYKEVGQEYRSQMKLVASFNVPLSWRNQYCGVYELKWEGLVYYFLDNEYYFKRPFAYGQFDDAERFAFYSKAVLEMIPHIGFKPDVIHCNDWQTGLIPVYLRLMGRTEPEYHSIKTVFTIHNIEYQGKYGKELLGDVFGLPDATMGMMEYNGSINLVKGAIVAADRVTTVSQTYSKEILTSEYSHGLDSILLENRYKLSGILNGIDVTSYNPETDKSIFSNYSIASIDKKAANKQQLQKMLGLAEDSAVPLIGLISRLVDHKGIDLISKIVEEMLSDNVQFVVLGTGEWQYEQLFINLQQKYPGKVSAHITFSNDLSRKIYAACDMFLMPSKSEPCGLSQIIALRYGSLPIVRETGGLADTIKSVTDDGASGNGFTFRPYNSADMLFTIRRALSFYARQPLWRKLAERAMTCDFSWSESARKYISIYKEIAGNSEAVAGVSGE